MANVGNDNLHDGIKSKVLGFLAQQVQNFAPVQSICAHLNALHVYASDPKRSVEANHYCSQVTEGIVMCCTSPRQWCLNDKKRERMNH